MSLSPLRIEVIEGRTVLLTWEDETSGEISAETLRAACMCATCREPSGEAATRAVLDGPVPVTINQAALVGGYAINFVFGPDGHGTGIFPYTTLHDMTSGAGDATAGLDEAVSGD